MAFVASGSVSLNADGQIDRPEIGASGEQNIGLGECFVASAKTIEFDEITFWSEGIDCAADLFLPDGPGPHPGIVMGHGWNQTKQGLRTEASRVRDIGIAVMLIDYRTIGKSGGSPRGQIFPRNQVEDLRNAVTYLRRRPEVDPERIGIYGVSFAGGLALQATAFDRRIKVCVSQSPIVSGRRWMREIRNSYGYDQLLVRLERNFEDRYGRGPDEQTMVHYPAAGTMEPYTGAAPPQARAAYDIMPSWDADNPNSCAFPDKCQDTFNPIIDLESIRHVIDFNPIETIDMIAPRPLLILANGGGVYDWIHTPESIQDAYARAGEPKELVFLPHDAFGFYQEPGRSEVMAIVLPFLQKHLNIGG